MDGIILLLMLASPLAFILLFRWFIKRWTGYDPSSSIENRYYQPKLDFIKLPDFYAAERGKQRESKINPHYDALVDAEWQARRLEESQIEDESDEIRSLSELLAKERQK